ncbi:MAG: protein kinase [Ktedonobacteraceae bacterium]
MINAQNLIGKYRIVEELSSGSFGRVYRAEDTSRSNAPVAVKLLHAAHVRSQQERNGFLQEARFLTLLRHPYILQVLDVGIEQDFPYLVTEYAPNGSLLMRLQKLAPRPLPIKDALHILEQVGQALQYAHHQNIIHRDLKPANILFHANGEALLADFGIATMLANSSEHGTAIGTPYYMAPEQFRGTISKEGDQYALGCIAYELLTGRLPFSAPDFFALGYKHMSETPIPPSQLNLLVPRSVESAILRAMAKQRGDRFPDVASFMAALGVPISELASGATPIILAAAPQPAYNEETLLTNLNDEDEDEGNMTIRRVLSSGGDMAIHETVRPSAPSSRPIAPPSIVQEDTGALPVVAMLSSMRNATRTYAGTEDARPAFSPADSLPREIAGTFAARSPMPFTPMPPDDGNEEDFLPFAPITERPSLLAVDDEEDGLSPVIMPPFATSFPPATRKKRRIWLIVAAALSLFLLLGGSAFAALYVTNSSFRHKTTVITSAIRKHLPVVVPPPPPPTPTATVTITPVQKSLSYNYNILAVGSPSPARQQVSARYLSNAPGSQSRTIPATGQGTIPGTTASGTVNIANPDPSNDAIIPGGTEFTLNGYSFIISSDVDVPFNSNLDVGAQAASSGSSGNIDIGVISGIITWGTINLTFYNDTAFTGGQDPQTYTYLQASDMSAAVAAANQLKTSLTTTAQSNVQGQIYAGGSLFGPVQCSSSASYNHGVGDRVLSVTTTVSAKCSGEVYNQQAALSMGANLLSQQVSSVPSASYKLLTKITTSIVSVAGVNGGIQIVVNAASVGLFQFSKGQRQELISLIVGKSEQDAQAILASQTGVSKVKITLANTTGTLLPASAKDITINVIGN